MYCQQRLVAYFYMILGLPNKDKVALSNGLNDVSSNKHLDPYVFDTTVIPSIQSLDGSGCAISMECPMDWLALDGTIDMPTTWNLTLTLAPLGEEARDSQHCKDRLKELLSRAKDNHAQSPFVYGQSYSEQNRFNQKHPMSMTQSQFDKATEIHHGRFRLLLSSTQRRIIQNAADVVKGGKISLGAKLISKFASKFIIESPKNEKQGILKRCLNARRSQCQETFCEGSKLNRICGLKANWWAGKKTDHFCNICYPEKDDFLVREQCDRIHRKEIQAFHGACVLLGIFIALAAFLYLLRGLYRRVNNRCRILRNLRRGRYPRNAPSSEFSMDSIPASFLFKSGMDGLRKEHPAAASDVDDSETSLSLGQRNLRQLGIPTRNNRRRVQDVFDLESHPTKRDENQNLKRVPVLPRAPNASLRRYFADGNPTMTYNESRGNNFEDPR